MTMRELRKYAEANFWFWNLKARPIMARKPMSFAGLPTLDTSKYSKVYDLPRFDICDVWTEASISGLHFDPSLIHFDRDFNRIQVLNSEINDNELFQFFVVTTSDRDFFINTEGSRYARYMAEIGTWR
jgi:hypothetical protein